MKLFLPLFISLFFNYISYSQNTVIHNKVPIKIYEAKNSQYVLIIFPSYGGNIHKMEKQTKLHEKANDQNISILYVGYNQKLFLKQEEKNKLSEVLLPILNNQFKGQSIYIGGFSSGGNVATLLSDHFIKKSLPIHGCFIIDSPIDLLNLYRVNQKNISLNFSEVAVNESMYINTILSDSVLQNYNFYDMKTGTSKASEIFISSLKMLIYSEYAPDWWYEQRGIKNTDTNYFMLTTFYKFLKKKGMNIDFYKSENKGFRSDGKRHPHSWSILDQNYLFNWIITGNKIQPK